MGINYGKYISRGVGAAALYLVARDAHVYGKIKADEHMKTKNADAALYYLNNTQTINKPSMTQIQLKDAVYKYELDNNIRGFINSGVGYFKGLGSMLVSDVVTLGLGIGALFAKGRALPLAKTSAIGLAGIGIYSLIKDGFGIGKQNDLTPPIQ